MPRKDSSKPDPFADLDLNDETPVEESSEETPEQPSVEPKPSKETVKLAFDPEFAVDDRVSEVVVSVAGSGIHTFPVDGTPVEVEPRIAELLVQSPAVKEVE